MSASPTTGGSAASGAAGVSRAPASLARFAGFSSDYWSRQLRAALDSRGQPLVRHRRWALSGFPSCFEGRELVSWLVRSGRVDSREEGAAVGEYLRRSNVLHHVTDGHGFEDRPLFYRFRCDDPEVCQQSPLPAPGVGALAGPRRGPSASQLLSERRLCLGGWWLKQGRVLLNLRFLVLDGDDKRLYVFTNDFAAAPRYSVSLRGSAKDCWVRPIGGGLSRARDAARRAGSGSAPPMAGGGLRPRRARALTAGARATSSAAAFFAADVLGSGVPAEDVKDREASSGRSAGPPQHSTLSSLPQEWEPSRRAPLHRGLLLRGWGAANDDDTDADTSTEGSSASLFRSSRDDREESDPGSEDDALSSRSGRSSRSNDATADVTGRPPPVMKSSSAPNVMRSKNTGAWRAEPDKRWGDDTRSRVAAPSRAGRGIEIFADGRELLLFAQSSRQQKRWLAALASVVNRAEPGAAPTDAASPGGGRDAAALRAAAATRIVRSPAVDTPPQSRSPPFRTASPHSMMSSAADLGHVVVVPEADASAADDARSGRPRASTSDAAIDTPTLIPALGDHDALVAPEAAPALPPNVKALRRVVRRWLTPLGLASLYADVLADWATASGGISKLAELSEADLDRLGVFVDRHRVALLHTPLPDGAVEAERREAAVVPALSASGHSNGSTAAESHDGSQPAAAEGTTAGVGDSGAAPAHPPSPDGGGVAEEAPGDDVVVSSSPGRGDLRDPGVFAPSASLMARFREQRRAALHRLRRWLREAGEAVGSAAVQTDDFQSPRVSLRGVPPHGSPLDRGRGRHRLFATELRTEGAAIGLGLADNKPKAAAAGAAVADSTATPSDADTAGMVTLHDFFLASDEERRCLYSNGGVDWRLCRFWAQLLHSGQRWRDASEGAAPASDSSGMPHVPSGMRLGIPAQAAASFGVERSVSAAGDAPAGVPVDLRSLVADFMARLLRWGAHPISSAAQRVCLTIQYLWCEAVPAQLNVSSPHTMHCRGQHALAGRVLDAEAATCLAGDDVANALSKLEGPLLWGVAQQASLGYDGVKAADGAGTGTQSPQPVAEAALFEGAVSARLSARVAAAIAAEEVSLLVFGTVGPALLQVFARAEAERDEALQRRLQELHGITLEDLDVPSELCVVRHSDESETLPYGEAVRAAARVMDPGCSTPYAKAAAVVALVDVLCECVDSAGSEGGAQPRLTADDLITLLAYVLIHLHARRCGLWRHAGILAHLAYCLRWLPEEHAVTRPGFYLITLQGACEYLLSVDAATLRGAAAP